MPLTAEINVALIKQICQKIGSESVNVPILQKRREQKVNNIQVFHIYLG